MQSKLRPLSIVFAILALLSVIATTLNVRSYLRLGDVVAEHREQAIASETALRAIEFDASGAATDPTAFEDAMMRADGARYVLANAQELRATRLNYLIMSIVAAFLFAGLALGTRHRAQRSWKHARAAT